MTETGLPDNAEILLYDTEDGAVKVDVLYRDESFWLTQKRMAELFGVQRPAITKHLKNIFDTKELQEDSVCSILEHTAADGKTYRTHYYNLDAIIAVGYRVNSRQAVGRRDCWASWRFAKPNKVCKDAKSRHSRIPGR